MPIDPKGRARIQAADAELMQQMAEGSADGFFAAIRRERDRNNVCGVSPFYLMLRLLGDVEGQVLAYDQCPADQANALAGVGLWDGIRIGWEECQSVKAGENLILDA